MQNAIEKNGVIIVRTPTGIAVGLGIPRSDKVLGVEVVYGGRVIKREVVSEFPWRDCIHGVDMMNCLIRVGDREGMIAELPLPPGEPEILPFMVLQGDQVHVTENYVSIPPALHITDDVGAVWTLGFKTAPLELAPKGEYAFNVLRDGVDQNEIASRIERRNGKVRIFTRHGWKRWTGQSFF